MQRKRIKDRRVQKTETLLRDALTSLIREKAYDSIVVKEILDRANVGRSAFYTHFRDKDELLASSIHEMLRPARSAQLPASAKPYEKIIRFSLPIFEQVGQHRHQHQHAGDAIMDDRSRSILHERLQNVLVELIRDDVEQCLQRRGKIVGMPANVLVNYVAATFVLVLNWWVEADSPLAAKEVDELFRALVLPTLVTILGE
ncbi:MAG TPA: TetR/AcrR family transcriptional regulator [Pyrinomonadaceae bacterium]|nr:TetR/AcrR family transcriptional regulator [Pyrinomonadaceae bacterium]